MLNELEFKEKLIADQIEMVDIVQRINKVSKMIYTEHKTLKDNVESMRFKQVREFESLKEYFQHELRIINKKFEILENKINNLECNK